MEDQEIFTEEGEITNENEVEETFNEDLIEDLSDFDEGEITDGTIVAVTEDSVFVDIGYKSEGEILKSEFKESPALGETIKVMILRMENKYGKLVLSKQKADELMKWESINKLYREGLPIEGKITDSVKGGFSVDIENIRAFLPLSQVSMKRIENPDEYLDKVLFFKIESIKGKKNIVLSHRKYLEELKEKQMEEFFSTKKEQDIVEGVVKSIVNYGAFIDVGGIDGLLHASDISWSKVTDPKKYLKIGDTVCCRILSIDPVNKKISLGMKQLIPDPWKSFEEKYERGKKYRGTVTKLITFGAFIELEEGIEGLLHISELSWTKKINHPKELLKAGDNVEIMILDYDISKRTISLGLKQIFPNPWDDIEIRYPVESRISAEVKRITKFGVFMELEEGIMGFLHVNDLSWTKTPKNTSELFHKGENHEMVIISIDKENRKIQLGMKQLKENPWESLQKRYPKGSIITGPITSITEFGVFVRVDKDIEGLIHISQLSNERVEHPNNLYKAGDEVKAVVMDIDKERKKVTLSIREYLNHLEEKEITKYIAHEDAQTASVMLGDLIDLNKIGK